MTKMDFSLAMYADICKALQPHKVVTIQEYLSRQRESSCIILRHDVDRDPQNALAMAKLEDEFGLNATYYFRYPHTFNLKAMTQIYNLGHEIGYHYEVLDKARGDAHKALDLFEKELEIFRKYFPVQTICMHGNPLTSWDGRDIWSLFDFREIGILGEAFLSCENISLYLTDTGRNWNGNNNFKDRVQAQNAASNFKNTLEVIRFLEGNLDGHIYLNCHPERWGPGVWGWSKALMRDYLFNFGKMAIKLFRSGSKERL